MFGKIRNTLAATAIVLGTTVFGISAANAINITWTGSGSTGVDPFGHAWTLQDGGWGIPGIGAGSLPWDGPDWITDFHITFFGNEIDQTGDTRMRSEEGGTSCCDTGWTEMFMGTDTAWFVAPQGVRLDPGEGFFVNVELVGGTPQTVNFIAEYTMVPEPTTLAVLGLGLVGLGLARRKRMI